VSCWFCQNLWGVWGSCQLREVASSLSLPWSVLPSLALPSSVLLSSALPSLSLSSLVLAVVWYKLAG